MAKVSLKHIIGAKKELFPILTDLIEQLQLSVWIEDDNEKILFGNKQENHSAAFSILLDDEVAGWVKGDEKAAIIAALLQQLLHKEAEKKKLGSEVLNLYQELNVIFNFTETLTQTIDPDVIARLTLEQAIHSISSNSGIIVLWDEETQQLQMPAIAGEPLFKPEELKENALLLLKIGLSGQSEIMTDISVLKEKQIIDSSVHSLIYAAMKVKHRIMGAIILVGKNEEQFSAGHLKLLVTLALQSSGAIESALLYEKNIKEAREREEAILKIHEVTKKFVPNEFISLLGKAALIDVKLGDQAENIVTVLFTDIRDFTSLSEQMTPEENFRFVSSFNERLGPIIRSNGGFINQYLGDSIMAIFPGQPEDALLAAIAMQKAIHTLNEERKADNLPIIRAGIGMHTGPLIMGITGDEHRLDAATISDTVNTASRIESLTKYYRSPLLLSEETYEKIAGSNTFHLRNLGKVQLKGKHKLITIFECINGYEPVVLEKKLSHLAAFHEAINHYKEQRFENAIQLFELIIADDPEDRTSLLFRDKAKKYIAKGVPENWTGAEEMLNK